MTSTASLSELKTWLSSILGDEMPSSWEVTPETMAILTTLYTRNTSMEEDTKVMMEHLKQTRAEYEAETSRLETVLTNCGPGVKESMNQGPAQSYADNIAGVCSSLDVDTCQGSGLYLALADLLVQQSEATTELSKQRNEVENLKANVVGLYEKFSRSKEELEKAEVNNKLSGEETAHRLKKSEFQGKKGIEYKKDIEKKEAVLAKNGGNDPSIKHKEIVKMKEKLDSLDEELKPLSRQLQGFLSLPPSVDLAKVELAKKEEELETLEQQLAGSISDMHI